MQIYHSSLITSFVMTDSQASTTILVLGVCTNMCEISVYTIDWEIFDVKNFTIGMIVKN